MQNLDIKSMYTIWKIHRLYQRRTLKVLRWYGIILVKLCSLGAIKIHTGEEH